MTSRQFLASVQDIIVGVVDFTLSARGAGSVRFVTRDDHAAHALQLRATRAGLRVRLTRPDDGAYVLGVSGFRFVPSGPLHTCDKPGGDRRPCPACTARV